MDFCHIYIIVFLRNKTPKSRDYLKERKNMIGKRDSITYKGIVTNKLRMTEIQEAPTSMVQKGEGTKGR